MLTDRQAEALYVCVHNGYTIPSWWCHATVTNHLVKKGFGCYRTIEHNGHFVRVFILSSSGLEAYGKFVLGLPRC